MIKVWVLIFSCVLLLPWGSWSSIIGFCKILHSRLKIQKSAINNVCMSSSPITSKAKINNFWNFYSTLRPVREKKIKNLWFLPLEANSAASLIFYTFFLNLAHCEPLQGKHVDGNKSYKKLVTNTLIPPCLLKLFWKNSWIWRWLWKKYLVFNEADECNILES